MQQPLVTPDGLSEIGPGIFRACESTRFVSRDQIEWLKAVCLNVPSRRARICLHQHDDDPVHEMIIAVHRTSYISPHTHPYKEESLQIIDGSADMLIFNEAGKIVGLHLMNAESRDRTDYIYRIPKHLIHGLRLRSDWIVFHEVAAGPLRPDANSIPSWVPKFDNPADGISWIEAQVDSNLSGG